MPGCGTAAIHTEYGAEIKPWYTRDRESPHGGAGICRDRSHASTVNDLMTTKEVAEYLRIKERKVYDLVQSGDIPCTRVTGKWLFPKHLVDIWIARGTRFPEMAAELARPSPAIVVGSHDPLLEWALRESGAGLALLPGGSLDGLDRFSRGDAMLCGLHVMDAESGDYNTHAVTQATAGLDAVMIGWAVRQQGLVLAPGNPLGIVGVADLKSKGARVALRQPEAGSRILFNHLVAEAGLKAADLDTLDEPLKSEADLALAVLEGKADAGLAVEAVAAQYRLDFLPLQSEQYDLLVRRRDYFEEPVQTLLAFTRTDAFQTRAAEMPGYDVAGLGRVRFNSN